MAKSAKRHLAVFGIMQSKDDVTRARNLLRNNGYRQSDISVLQPSEDSMGNLAHERSSKAPEGAAIGLILGVIAGALAAWLLKLNFIGVPGAGSIVGGGQILAVLACAGISGTLGGLVGALIGLGIPEYEVTRYEGFVREGGWLISVHADSMAWARRAQSLLKACGAKDISLTSEKMDLAMTGTEDSQPHRDYPPYF